ncbi:MAG: hypothetical protein Q4G22_14570 [Paracoccus sp. (in: a-proteobacteria)]|uniref:hypothetical protein n=1 Tax=Paracoccus sp. TaxID=267 RepID=UPI0026E00464|nr:hypothetical protein [Paracoccus sp. (in: a-proteobacteria)]MDO5633038.1 hypothetical protein [Paracoccus sp. (in: a-proteobacteria)]
MVGQYVYRGESPWSVWDQFFNGSFCGTWWREIDDCADAHRLNKDPTAPRLPALPPGHHRCGFWVFGALADGVRFCQTEPRTTPEARYAAAFGALTGRPDGWLKQRILIRIDRAALSVWPAYPDRALTYAYPSTTMFLTSAPHDGPPQSGLCRAITLPDQAIEIFFRGHWHQKSPDLGIWLRDQITVADDLRHFAENLPDPLAVCPNTQRTAHP